MPEAEHDIVRPEWLYMVENIMNLVQRMYLH